MRRFTKITVMAGLTLAALTGNAMAQDLRSPDARDAARSTASVIDLRSPDARDAARSSDIGQAAGMSDLRSPDARDTTGVQTYVSGVTPETYVVHVPTTSFHWGDAGIGAGATAGALLLASLAGVAVIRRRGRLVF